MTMTDKAIESVRGRAVGKLPGPVSHILLELEDRSTKTLAIGCVGQRPMETSIGHVGCVVHSIADIAEENEMSSDYFLG
jgi:hypothetical protein